MVVIRILLQLTTAAAQDDWNIGRFSLLADHLRSLRNQEGNALCDFGVVRVLWVVPHVGVRNAELLEHPSMLVVIFVTAKWIVRYVGGKTGVDSLAIGFLALGLLLLAEVFVTLFAQPNRVGDPVSGIVYFPMLALFAVMPWLLSTWQEYLARRN